MAALQNYLRAENRLSFASELHCDALSEEHKTLPSSSTVSHADGTSEGIIGARCNVGSGQADEVIGANNTLLNRRQWVHDGTTSEGTRWKIRCGKEGVIRSNNTLLNSGEWACRCGI
jgi:hypothetical protein